MRLPPEYPAYPIDTLRDLLFEIRERFAERPALQSKKNGAYQPTTFGEFADQVECVATFLLNSRLQKQDTVGVLGENSTEWAVVYLATVASGLIIVPVDKDLKSREIKHILNFSRVSLLFCTSDCLPLLKPSGELPDLKTTIVFEEGADGFSFSQALRQGKESIENGDHQFAGLEVSPQDTASLLFTSGTMGNSKAVMLSHQNLAANIVSMSRSVSIRQGETLLSVLPMHHTYECTCGFLTGLYQGACVYHAESLRRIPENLQESGASVMLGVPLLFESFYRRIEKGIKEKGELKFRLALALAAFSQKILGLNIRRRLFQPLHKRMGGSLRLFISGGAAINPEISRGFRELGINLLQGYGLTEASPLISVNREHCLKDASAGLPIPGVEVRVVDGEILVRGASVMKGYFLNPEATAETLRDGWLHTGDLGYVDRDGFLFISGRKKSVIVMANGKNVYPEEVEAALNESEYILESLVWGGPDSKVPEVQAIIVADRNSFDLEFCARGYDSGKVSEVIEKEVKRCNRALANYKRIHKFTLREEEFEKTTTRKIKRYLYTGQPQRLEDSLRS